LLRDVIEQLVEKHYVVGNIDVTILAQAPKILPFIPKMKSILAEDVNVDVLRLNIKATTTEKMGFIGRLEGIAVYAVCLLEENN